MERFNHWLYRGNRPNRVARILNRLSAWLYASARSPQFVATLEVRGRSTGKPVSLPVVVIELDQHRYLVSMLGQNVNWVKNVRAGDGDAVLIKGQRTPIHLIEVPIADRPPVIQRYLQVATSGRQHFPIPPDASLDQIATIAAEYPVFRVDPA